MRVGHKKRAGHSYVGDSLILSIVKKEQKK